MADEERIASCIRGYHIYKTVWKARIGEVLPCAREPTNAIDRYAVSVFKNGTVVGHLPKRNSRVCSSLIRRGGEIMCDREKKIFQGSCTGRFVTTLYFNNEEQ